MKLVKRLLVAGISTLIASTAISATSLYKEMSNPHPIKVEISPMALLGVFSASVGVGVNENFMVGAMGGYTSLSIFETKIKGSSYGAFAGYYANGAASDSSYVKAFAAAGSSSVEFDKEWTLVDQEGKNQNKIDFKSQSAGAMFGYQWVWDSGFSLNLALGGQYLKLNDKTEEYKLVKNDKSETKEFEMKRLKGLSPAAELGLGMVF